MELPLHLNRMSVRRQLGALIVGAAAVLLLLLILSLGVYEYLSARHESELQLKTHAAVMAKNIAPALMFDDRVAIAQNLGIYSADPGMLLVLVRSFDDQVVGYYSRDRKTLTPEELQQAVQRLEAETTGRHRELFDRTPHLYWPIMVSGEQVGSILLEQDYSHLRRRLWEFLWIVLILLLVGCGCCYSFIRRLSRLITEPLEEMAGLMRQVAQTRNFHLRSTVAAANELGTLSSGMNSMLLEVDRSDMALKRVNDELEGMNNQLEKRVAERTRELQESEARWQFALDGAGDGVWDWDLERNIVYYSRQWKAMQGYAEDEIGDSLEEFSDRIHPDDRDEVFRQVQRYWSGESEQFRPEFRFCRKDGGYNFILGRGVVVQRADDGHPLRMIGTHTDITGHKQLENELRRASCEAEAANRAKSAFLANMSHEIRTPLNGIVGFTQLLEDLDLDQQGKQYLQAIKTSSDNLLALVSNILDLSKIEADRLELEQSDFSPGVMLHDVLLTQRGRATTKQLKLELQQDEQLPVLVIGDELRFKQVILNLVGNAIKFTPEGGSVRVSSKLLNQERGRVTIAVSVQDSGIGIAPEALERIFHPFEQADTSTTRRFGGSGLGLTICQRLLSLMGGSLQVESTPGSGSTFTVQVPFEVSLELPQEPEPSVEPGTLGCLWHGKPLHLLLVEDNKVNQQLVVIMLQKMGFSVLTADSGEEALECLAVEAVDLMLLDVNLPEMSGTQVVGAIRQREREQGCGHLPVIAVTANALRGDREQFLDDGFDAYLAKPFRFAQLAELMQTVLPPEKRG